MNRDHKKTILFLTEKLISDRFKVQGGISTRFSIIAKYLLLLIPLTIPVNGQNEDYDINWSYSTNIYINTTATGADVSSDVLSFPLLIRLDSSNFNFSQAKSDGTDIRFAKSDGSYLSFEQERWDNTNELAEFWVLCDTIYGNNNTQYIKIYWGNDTASDRSKPEDVFKTSSNYDFNAVWHLNEAGTGTRYDATSNDNDGSPQNYDGDEAISSGTIDGADDFDGADDYVDILNAVAGGHSFTDLSDSITLSAWIKADMVSGTASYWRPKYTVIELRTQQTVGSHVTFSFGVDDSNVMLGTTDKYISHDERHHGNTTLSIGMWYHIAVTIDGDDYTIYLNGANDGNGTFVLSTGDRSVGSNTANMQIGIRSRDGGEKDYCMFDGIIDEVRVSSCPRSADWIKLCYETQKLGQAVVTTVIVPVTGVSLSPSSLSLTPGQTSTLTATISPSDATNKTVSWSSGNTDVATVDTNGMVTAVAVGTTIIIVTTQDGDKTDTCTVTATIPVTGVILSPESLSLAPGETSTLTATISPSNATDQTVSWTSGNTDVATVDNNGMVTAVAVGTTIIIVTTQDGGKTDTCIVTASIPVTGVILSPESLSLAPGETSTLTATISPSNATDQSVSWTSGNTDVATVDNNGMVTAVAAGTAVITVTTNDGGKTGTCTVSVGENYDINWSYSTNIYINTTATGADVSSDVLSFPLLIRLDSSNFNFSQAKSDGTDIRFAKSDGSHLSFEQERWDNTNELAEFWVLCDTIYGNNNTQYIKIYWGNDTPPDRSKPEDVFKTSSNYDFNAVWHLNEAGTGTRYDATSNDNDGNPQNYDGDEAISSGTIDGADDFDGTDDYVDILNAVAGGHSFTDLSDSITLSAWIKADTVSGTASYWRPKYTVIELRTQQTVGSHVTFSFGVDDNNVMIGLTDKYISNDERHHGNTTLSTGTWYHIAVTIDGDDYTIYLNGANDGNGTFVLSTGDRSVGSNTANMQIGIRSRDGGEKDYCMFDGIIDEVRVSSCPRSADWIKLSYETQKLGQSVVTLITTCVDAYASVSGPITCTNTSVILTGNSPTSGVTFRWTGPEGYVSTQQNTITSIPGEYILSVINPLNGCVSVDKVIIQQDNAAPEDVTATVQDTLTCTQTSVILAGTSSTGDVTYNWSGPNSFSSTEQNLLVINPGIYSLVVTDLGNGCTSLASVSVKQDTTYPSDVLATVSGILTCTDTTVTLTGSSSSGEITYSWLDPNSINLTGNPVAVSIPGTYKLTITSTVSGCIESANVTVEQDMEAPEGLTASVSDTLDCEVTSVILSASSTTTGVTYRWEGPQCFTSNEQYTVTSTPGNYSVITTNSNNGCISVEQVKVIKEECQ